MAIVNGKYVGYCEPSELPIKRGDKVKIKKGVHLSSTHPDPARKSFTAGRTYTVTVDHLLGGSNTGMTPSVRWHGTGGYWFEANINDVELVAAKVGK